MTTFFFLFIIIWWLTIFCVLPFGNQPVENVQKGNAASAPAKPRLWLKMLINTIIALILTGILTWLIQSGLLDSWILPNDYYQ